jgi:DNA transposition AAA+ family ATPase
MNRFVETSISRTIEDVVSYARQTRRAAAIMGPPGIGKTFALQNIANRESNIIMVTASSAQATEKATWRLVASALNIFTREDSADIIWRTLEDNIPVNAAIGQALMIDEAQRLDLKVLVEIVDFPARFGLPVIIAGNPDLLKRTRVQTGAFAQIASRCAKKAILTRPLTEDFVSIMVDFDVYGEDAREAGVNYGLHTSIRELVQMLEAAKGFAERGPVRVEEMQRATAYVHGGSKALSLLSSAA